MPLWLVPDAYHALTIQYPYEKLHSIDFSIYNLCYLIAQFVVGLFVKHILELDILWMYVLRFENILEYPANIDIYIFS